MTTPKRRMDWKGLKVVSTIGLQNGWAILPAGTEYIVTGWSKGLELASIKCSKCGGQQRITGVSEHDVEIVEADLNYEILIYNEECHYENITDGWGRRLIKPDRNKPEWQT